MTSLAPLDYDCVRDQKPNPCRIVWLVYPDGFAAPGMWNGRGWWPDRHHGQPLRWRELQPKELSYEDEVTFPIVAVR